LAACSGSSEPSSGQSRKSDTEFDEHIRVPNRTSVLKTKAKNTYAKTGLIKAIPRVIHNLELGLPQDPTNILVINTIFRI